MTAHSTCLVCGAALPADRRATQVYCGRRCNERAAQYRRRSGGRYQPSAAWHGGQRTLDGTGGGGAP